MPKIREATGSDIVETDTPVEITGTPTKINPEIIMPSLVDYFRESANVWYNSLALDEMDFTPIDEQIEVFARNSDIHDLQGNDGTIIGGGSTIARREGGLRKRILSFTIYPNGGLSYHDKRFRDADFLSLLDNGSLVAVDKHGNQRTPSEQEIELFNLNVGKIVNLLDNHSNRLSQPKLPNVE